MAGLDNVLSPFPFPLEYVEVEVRLKTPNSNAFGMFISGVNTWYIS